MLKTLLKLLGVAQRGDFHQRKKEPEYEWLMRRLGDLRFWFRDLGLTRAQSRRGLIVLRHKLGVVVDAFAGKQGVASIAFEAVGDFGLNQIKYIPPRHLVHVALGDRAEVGYSATRNTSVLRGVRFSTAMALRGLDASLSSRHRYLGLAPVAGIELRVIRITDAPGVDVSSGVERSRGVKDPVRIAAFVAAARLPRAGVRG